MTKILDLITAAIARLKNFFTKADKIAQEVKKDTQP
jgi:hypothetical protein